MIALSQMLEKNVTDQLEGMFSPLLTEGTPPPLLMVGRRIWLQGCGSIPVFPGLSGQHDVMQLVRENLKRGIASTH